MVELAGWASWAGWAAWTGWAGWAGSPAGLAELAGLAVKLQVTWKLYWPDQQIVFPKLRTSPGS